MKGPSHRTIKKMLGNFEQQVLKNHDHYLMIKKINFK